METNLDTDGAPQRPGAVSHSALQGPTRPYTPADRSVAIVQLGDRRAIDQPSHHLHVAESGPAAGIALWVEPGPGGEPYLGAVKVAGENRSLLYQLVAASIQDALDRGFERGYLTVHDRRLLARIQRDFDVQPQPAGWDPNTGQPVQWDIHGDLREILQQLQRVILRADSSSSSVETHQDEGDG